jgi:hypothetical protein
MEGDNVCGAIFHSDVDEVVKVMRMFFLVPQRGIRAFADANPRVTDKDVSEPRGKPVDTGVDEIRYPCMLLDIPEV